MKSLIAAVLLAFLVSSQVNAGGSIGGGTGLIVRQDTPMISQMLFQQLVQSGSLDEPIVFNDQPARVRTVDFEQKIVELAVEGQAEPTILQQETADEPIVDMPQVEPPVVDQPADETLTPAPESVEPEAAQPVPETTETAEEPKAYE